MCKSSSRNFNRGVTLALVAVLALLMAPAAYAQTGNIQMSSGPAYPGLLVVGQTNVPVQYFIANGAAPNSTEPIVINFGAGDVVRYMPACSVATYPCLTPETGIAPGATGQGVGANPGCNQTWTFSFIDAQQGYAMTAPNNLILNQGESCQINFTINVTAVPAGGSTFGTGFATAHGTTTPGLTGSGSGSTLTNVQSCSAQVDKQVRCGGGTWFDVGSTVGVTEGPICATGSAVETRFFIQNTGTALLNCTVQDNVLAIAGGSVTNLAAGATSSAFSTVNPQTCNLTSGQSGDNTATLASCTCPVSVGDPLPANTGNPDSATYACAGVTIDKQVSCDTGANWADQNGQVTANQGGTNGCVGAVNGANTQARWFAQASGNVALDCSLDDSNNVFQPAPQPVALATNAIVPVGTPAAATACMTALAGGEPNTATLTCNPVIVGGLVNTLGTLSVFDIADFECCGVQVDKQVSCNGGGFVDTGYDDNAVQSCSTELGLPVAVRYIARNTGSIPVTCNTGDQQGLVDLNALDTLLSPTTIVGGIAPGAETPFIPNPGVTTCTQRLNDGEVNGNTATLSCTCQAGGNLGGNVPTGDSDTAQIQCATPNITARKVCEETAPNTFVSHVFVNNDGPVGATCTVADRYYPAPGCPVPFDPNTGTALPMIPASLNVPALAQNVEATSGPFSPTESVCNTAQVICTTTGGQVLQPINVVDHCPVAGEGCFTRTPGYWGTHPSQTLTVINEGGTGLNVCGIPLTNVLAATQGSAIENMCGTGGPDFKPNNTSPQQLQLIRQCTAAALNLKTSLQSDLNCESEFQNITSTWNLCCGDGGVCDSGASATTISASGCIEFLDAFNNSDAATGDDFPNWLVNTKADSSVCQAANGNGFVNGGVNLGPGGTTGAPKKGK